MSQPSAQKKSPFSFNADPFFIYFHVFSSSITYSPLNYIQGRLLLCLNVTILRTPKFRCYHLAAFGFFDEKELCFEEQIVFNLNGLPPPYTIAFTIHNP